MHSQESGKLKKIGTFSKKVDSEKIDQHHSPFTLKKAFPKKPTATSLSTPIYHRKRRDWKDDQLLIEELESILHDSNATGEEISSESTEFLNIVESIRKNGFEANADAIFLAMWIREQLLKMAAETGSYDLRVHPIALPGNLSEVIMSKDRFLTNLDIKKDFPLSLEQLFPDSRIRGFALERIQLLHHGNLLAYLHTLVARERDSLHGYSASISDLIHICEHKIRARKLRYVSRFDAAEVDIWVPGLSLGIEIRDSLTEKSKEALVEVFLHTNSLRHTTFVVLVCPDHLSDVEFNSWRQIERSGIVPNLSTIRIGDLGNYLDKLSGA